MKFTGERFVPSKSGMIALQHYHRYEFALHLVDFSDKSVLDIACGEGYGTNILASQAKIVYGVDISEESIENAQNVYADEKVKFLLGDVANIPLPDHSIDIAVSFETIEHHDMHSEMMAEIKRVLKHDGILIISTPDKGYYEKYFQGFKNEFHIKELYKYEFKVLLQTYFKNLVFFTQNNVFGSVITCDADYTNTINPPLHFDKTRNRKSFFEPRFVIALASNSGIVLNTTTSFFTFNSETDPFTEIERLTEVINNIHASRSWRLISILRKPFSFLKKKVR